jgi:DMSO reductase family type II enzyme heme b subunit
MKVHHIKNVDLNDLLDLGAGFWSNIKPTRVSLEQTPVALQPTPAIRQEYENKRYGNVRSVGLCAAHNGRFVAFKMHWYDPDEDLEVGDNNRFVDAAAIMLGSVPAAPIAVMGVPGMPVNALYWRADERKKGRNVIAEGIGTSRTLDTEMVVCNERWEDKAWNLIMARPLLIETEESIAQLPLGYETPYGVAIWEGSGGERAGIKSFGLGVENLIIEKAA